MDQAELENPPIQIGWVSVTAPANDVIARVRKASDWLRENLARQLPEFDWNSDFIERRPIQKEWRIDPLVLLELGVQEKVERGWDFAIVVTDSDLLPRDRAFVLGAPSSALETAVISLARSEEDRCQLVDLAQFLLGSMLGLEPKESGAMRPPEMTDKRENRDFSPDELDLLRERLRDVGDTRLEEEAGRKTAIGFRLRSFAADPKGILKDIIGNRPWLQPFRLGRLTGAAFVTALLSFLGAEVWELGIGFNGGILFSGAILTILATSWFLYSGQNLTEITRHRRISEQAARTEWVLGLSIFVGMASLWILLALVSFAIATVLPRNVIENWIGESLDIQARVQFAAFVSTIGTLAGALGGNLEDENDFKARFFIDEEI